MKEWEVICRRCGVKEGAPCENNINGPRVEVYDRFVHKQRVLDYRLKHGLNVRTGERVQ